MSASQNQGLSSGPQNPGSRRSESLKDPPDEDLSIYMNFLQNEMVVWQRSASNSQPAKPRIQTSPNNRRQWSPYLRTAPHHTVVVEDTSKAFLKVLYPILYKLFVNLFGDCPEVALVRVPLFRFRLQQESLDRFAPRSLRSKIPPEVLAGCRRPAASSSPSSTLCCRLLGV